jgi:3-oxoacyl-(acyl-carrier-protein) synthase
MKVAITGIGIISSIGNTVEENFHSLVSLKTGLSTISNIETIHKDIIKVGEIKLTNEQLAEQLNLPSDNNYSRTALLGAIAAKQAVENAKISDMNAYKSGLISATSVGGMDMTEKYYYEYFENEACQKYITSHDIGDNSQKNCELYRIKRHGYYN